MKGLERISEWLTQEVEKVLFESLATLTRNGKVEAVGIIISDQPTIKFPIKWDRENKDGKSWFADHFLATAKELNYKAMIIVGEATVDVSLKADGTNINHEVGLIILARSREEVVKVFVPFKIEGKAVQLGEVQVSFSMDGNLFTGVFK